MRLFPSLSVKRISTKLLIVFLPIIIVFSLVTSILGPEETKKHAMSAAVDKAQSIAEMTAFSLSPAVYLGDVETIEEIILSVRQNKDLAYLAVADDTGKVIASYQKNPLKSINFQERRNSGISADGTKSTTTIPISYKGRRIGQLYLGLSLEGVLENIQAIRKRFIFISALIFLFGVFAIFGVSQLITGPLRRVAETARQIAKGDLTKRATVFGQDEVGRLGLAFNTMVDQLWDAQTTLEKKVAERTKELQAEMLVRGKTDEALRESEEFVRSMVESLSEGICIADKTEKLTFANPAADQMFGLERGGLVGDTLRDFTTPEQYAVILQQTKRRARGERSAYEFRICRPDGEERIISVAAIPRLDKFGNYIGSLGVFSDITERKKSEDSIREANEKLQLSIQELERRNTEMGLLSELYARFQMCGEEKDVHKFISSFAPKLFPKDSGALYIFKASRNLLEAADSWGDSPPRQTILAPDDCWSLRGNKPYSVDDQSSGPLCPHVESDGQSFAPYICLPLMSPDETLGFLHIRFEGSIMGKSQKTGASEDNRANKLKKRLALNFGDRMAMAISSLRMREQLRQQSIRDPLTGLFNRRYMEEAFAQNISRASRAGETVGIIMLDIDYFKRFNDDYGHEAGDLMLKSLGQLFQTNFRKEDVVCRYGGEEFVLILPGVSLEMTKQRAVDLLSSTKSLKLDFYQKTLGPISLSMGIAMFPKDGNSETSLLQAADAALFRAKKSGRSCIVVNGE